jgi:hypothetical protein
MANSSRPASSATVRPDRSAPSCAAASTPRGRPEVTTIPAPASASASSSAIHRLAAEALRAPTSATWVAASTAGSPRTAIAGGASSVRARSGG